MRSGGQPGNTNAAKGKRFYAIAERLSAEEKYKSIEAAVRQMFEKAADGDLKAIEMLRDTFDGKPAQQLNHAGHDGDALVVTLAHNDSSAV